MFTRLLQLLRIVPSTPSTPPDTPCTHPFTGPIQFRVFGSVLTQTEPVRCARCTTRYLESVCARCAACKGPIFPGQQVAQLRPGAREPYTHLLQACCPFFGLHCGTWGMGKLVPLHEADPRFPPGTATVADHVIATGECVTVTA